MVYSDGSELVIGLRSTRYGTAEQAPSALSSSSHVTVT